MPSMSILFVLGFVGLGVSFNQRLLDPLTPLVATELGVDPHLIVMLSPAFTLPYALVQPFLGPVGDSFGKAMILRVCICVLIAASIGAALATTYEVLLPLRLLAGLAGGGVIPTSLALIADRYPLEQRQVAMSRFMVSLIVGQLFAGPLAAGIAQTWSWHQVPLFAALLASAGLVMLLIHVKPRAELDRPPFSVANALKTYRTILADPRARACYVTVFAEWMFVFGFTPHIALFLKAKGFGNITEAGYVLAGFGIGGVIFSFLVSWLVRRFDPFRIMQVGGILMGAGVILIPFLGSWQAIAAAFSILGFGFYMLHSGLQARVTEILPQARASAVSLHAFFLFLGIAGGPVVVEFFSQLVGFTPTLVVNGMLMIVMSFLAIARLLKADRERSHPT